MMENLPAQEAPFVKEKPADGILRMLSCKDTWQMEVNILVDSDNMHFMGNIL